MSPQCASIAGDVKSRQMDTCGDVKDDVTNAKLASRWSVESVVGKAVFMISVFFIATAARGRTCEVNMIVCINMLYHPNLSFKIFYCPH